MMDEIKKSIYSSRVLNVVRKQADLSAPSVALFRRVAGEVGLTSDELEEIVDDLKERGFVETGRAINDTYIKPIIG